MADSSHDALLLKNQLCFPLYAASRLMTRLYQPVLEPMGLTYPQYVVLMILWEHSPQTVSGIGKRALLNTNTLTPVLKRLEQLGYIKRNRSIADQRVVEVELTQEGRGLRELCAGIPAQLGRSIGFTREKTLKLKGLLDEFIDALDR